MSRCRSIFMNDILQGTDSAYDCRAMPIAKTGTDLGRAQKFESAKCLRGDNFGVLNLC